jgi:hypothetical protein
MADIHGFIFIGIGLFVAVFSKIIDTQTNGDSFTVFFFIGIIMMVYGGLKMFIFKGKKPEKKVLKKHPSYYYAPQKPQAQQPSQPRPQTSTQQFRYCPNCGTPVAQNAYFCYKCGGRVR